MKRQELIQTDEYWQEILSNSMWRVRMNVVTVKQETRYLMRKIKELKKVLKEKTRKDSGKENCDGSVTLNAENVSTFTDKC